MRWMWIDRIVDYEPQTRLVAVKAVSAGEDQLQAHFDAEGDLPALPVMPASLMIEGMAQTAGILVGSCRKFEEKVILAKIVTARFDAEVLPGDVIRYDATLDRIDDAGAATSGAVALMRAPRAEWVPLGQVDLMFSHVDQNMAGLAFPEENFVFDENLSGILRTAGHPDLVL